MENTPKMQKDDNLLKTNQKNTKTKRLAK